jgi:hypothetical protein
MLNQTSSMTLGRLRRSNSFESAKNSLDYAEVDQNIIRFFNSEDSNHPTNE